MMFKISSEKIEEFIEEQHAIDGMVSMHDFELWLEEQPRVGEWTPCSERLPEEEGRYLITISDIGVVSSFYNKNHKLPWGGYETECVIAWMPLPEPYKEQTKK